MDWDYKQVRVTVSSVDTYATKEDINKELVSLFSRDSEQPALTGNNLRMCVFKGWEFGMDFSNPKDVVPVSNVKLTIDGKSVFSTSNGEALFIGLKEGSNYVYTDPTFKSMIVYPGKTHNSPQEVKFPKVGTGTTQQRVVLVEYPSKINVSIKDGLNNTPLRVSGEFVFDNPYNDNNPLIKFSSANIDLDGNLSYMINDNSIFSNLWPIGTYGFSNFNIPGYVPSVKNQWDSKKMEIWDGTFVGPDTEKDIILFFIKTPDRPDDNTLFNNDWVLGKGNSHNITSNSKKPIAFKETNEGNVLIGSEFKTYSEHDLIAKGKDVEFWASEIYFSDNLLKFNANANDSGSLILNSNMVHFRNGVDFYVKKDVYGEIVLNVIHENFIINEKEYIISQESLNYLKKGDEIQNIDGITGDKDKYYGQVYFEEDINYKGYILEKGAYYFPDGASFPSIIIDGGLIQM